MVKKSNTPKKTKKKEVTQKKIGIQAFIISCNHLKYTPSDLITFLKNELHDSKVSSRKFKISSLDTEEDLLAFYEITDKMFHGIMFRIDLEDKHNSLSNDLLDKDIIDLNDINSIEVGDAFVVKDYFYFLIKGDILVTSYMNNRTITSFETYINKLLKYEETGTVFSFTPKVVDQANIPLTQLKYVEVAPQVLNKNQGSGEESKKSVFDITNIISKFGDLFDDVKAFKEIKESNIISASILFKICKPKGMTKEEYQRLLGTSLKPVAESDTESIVYKTKNGTVKKGKELLCKKSVTVNMTSNGKIAENELFLAMNNYIEELK